MYSDHNPLSFLTESVPKSAKLMQWALALQEFSIVFQYYPGRKNVVADCLSRLQELTTMNGQYRIVQLIFVCICTSVALIVFLVPHV